MIKHVIIIEYQEYAFDRRYRWSCTCGSQGRIWQDSGKQAARAGDTHVRSKAQSSLFPRKRQASP